MSKGNLFHLLLSFITVFSYFIFSQKTLKIEAMPMAVAGVGVAAAPAVEVDDAKETAAAVKSTFTVKLTKLDESKKVAVIKEVKSLVEGLNLVQVCKTFPL